MLKLKKKDGRLWRLLKNRLGLRRRINYKKILPNLAWLFCNTKRNRTKRNHSALGWSSVSSKRIRRVNNSKLGNMQMLPKSTKRSLKLCKELIKNFLFTKKRFVRWKLPFWTILLPAPRRSLTPKWKLNTLPKLLLGKNILMMKILLLKLTLDEVLLMNNLKSFKQPKTIWWKLENSNLKTLWHLNV